MVTTISGAEFERICRGIARDRESIIRHNPVGTEDEILLWMLLSCLVGYMSLSESETPCFPGSPNAETYREAIKFILRGRMAEDFDADRIIDRMLDHKP